MPHLNLLEKTKVIDFNQKKLYRELRHNPEGNNSSLNERRLPFDRAYILQGEILTSLCRYNDAINAFNLALNLNPFSTVAYTSLSYIYDMKNLPNEALKFNKKAFETVNYNEEGKELKVALYDQQFSLYSKLNMLAELKNAMVTAQQDLSHEDFDYLFECYKNQLTIDSNRKLFAI